MYEADKIVGRHVRVCGNKTLIPSTWHLVRMPPGHLFGGWSEHVRLEIDLWANPWHADPAIWLSWGPLGVEEAARQKDVWASKGDGWMRTCLIQHILYLWWNALQLYETLALGRKSLPVSMTNDIVQLQKSNGEIFLFLSTQIGPHWPDNDGVKYFHIFWCTVSDHVIICSYNSQHIQIINIRQNVVHESGTSATFLC